MTAFSKTAVRIQLRRGALSLGVVVLVVIVVIVTALVLQAGRIVTGTTVGDVDLSGLTRAAAISELETVAANRPGTTATVTFDDVDHTLADHEAAVAVDVPATVDAAYQRGRGSVTAILGRPLSLFRRVEVPLKFRFDDAAIDAFVQSIAATHNRPMVDGSLAMTEQPPFVAATLPQVGVVVDEEANRDLTVRLLTGELESPLPVVADLSEPRLSVPHVTQLADALLTVLAAPRTVTIESSSVTLTPRELADLITLVEETTETGAVIIEVVIDPQQLPERLLAAASRHTRDSEPARFSSPQRPDRQLTTLGDVTVEPIPYPIFVVPSVDGRIVDAHDLAAQLTTAIANGQTRPALRLRAVASPEPNHTHLKVVPTHLLATFTSPLIAGQARNVNIGLLAETLDDRVVMPGKSFSINEISGPRRCSDGYVPAGVILRGELVDACGGGVSQVGTTVLNAAFFAGVQLDAFTPHSFYIGRYSPGREATLSYPQLDVAFTNTTPGALHLRAFTTATSLTVSLYGTPAHTSVAAKHGPRTNPRPLEEERRRVDTLPRGTERVLQSGGGGFTITVTRIITRTDGSEDTEQFTTRYLPQRRIVEYNPAPSPPPAPPEPEDPPSGSETEAAPREPTD